MNNILYVNFRTGKITSMDTVQSTISRLERIKKLQAKIDRLNRELQRMRKL